MRSGMSMPCRFELSVVARVQVRFEADETYELLCDHATHGDTDDVDAAVFGPADVVKELDEIFCHFRGRVSEEWLATLAHASVVKDERGVLFCLCVAEVLELAHPRVHMAAQSHDEL